MHDYLDGTLTADGLASLNRALESDPQARETFAMLLDLDASLGRMAQSGNGGEREGEFAFPGPETGRRRTIVAISAWAAALAVCALLWGAWSAGTRPFAVVVESTGAGAFREHSGIRGERIVVADGMVRLSTRRGAEVVIEAPATFRFESAQRLCLESGRLAAEVPESAEGFTVVTPDGDAVDLGTRFGVDVRKGGASEIHVFEGEVVARAGAGSGGRSLRGGEALAMDAGGGGVRELRSAAFIQSDEVAAIKAGLVAGQQARSLAASDALASDPSLVALIGFGREAAYPGVFRTVQGRWPGSWAVEFVEVGDYLQMNVEEGETWPQLTLAAWARLDRVGEPYQSLLHTDGWSDDKPGQVHWMINGDATMRLALRGNTLAPGEEGRHGFPDSRTPVLPERGRWVHLAVVYDSVAKTVRFYLNGRFDKEVRQAVAHPARLGSARIGNWDRTDRKLSGRIDEFVILGRVLDDAEIRALYESGTPYR
ncbi:MAG TPA: FecR domain-containing protein [Bacteroidia bacterium]|nr:FecR domain-containing protein [Bacteroidia bacterium]